MTYREGNFEGHGYDDWMTPEWLLTILRSEFGDLHDPCPANWDGKTDGLLTQWPLNRASFVNPPYGNLAAWVAKCAEQGRRGCVVILLVAPRVDTKYFWDHIHGVADIRYIKGRLKFIDARSPNDSPKGAPFPSILCVWNQSHRVIGYDSRTEWSMDGDTLKWI